MGLSLLALVVGFGLNLLVKKPAWSDFLIRLSGSLVAFLERVLNDSHPEAKKKERNPKREYLWGIVMTVLVTILSVSTMKLILILSGMIHALAAFVLEVFLCWLLLNTRSVHDDGIEIYEKLRKESMDAMDDAVVTKQTLKAMLADMISGTLAPMFYMMLGGAALGVFYMVIHVMAKMVGRSTDRYCYFGIFAVKLYPMVHFIPAQLTALFMMAAVMLLKMDKKNARKIYIRDLKKHKGQNGSYAESVVAGALRIQLADTVWDAQELYEKQLFEEDGRPVKPTDILRVNRLVYYSVTIALVIFVIIKMLIIFLL